MWNTPHHTYSSCSDVSRYLGVTCAAGCVSSHVRPQEHKHTQSCSVVGAAASSVAACYLVCFPLIFPRLPLRSSSARSVSPSLCGRSGTRGRPQNHMIASVTFSTMKLEEMFTFFKGIWFLEPLFGGLSNAGSTPGFLVLSVLQQQEETVLLFSGMLHGAKFRAFVSVPAAPPLVLLFSLLHSFRWCKQNQSFETYLVRGGRPETLPLSGFFSTWHLDSDTDLSVVSVSPDWVRITSSHLKLTSFKLFEANVNVKFWRWRSSIFGSSAEMQNV